MSVLLVVCALLASLVAGVLAVAAWLWTSRLRASIPGPPTLPLLGNATMFYELPVLLDRLAKLHRRYGDIFRFYVGPKLIIVVTQPEDVQRLMLTSKPRERDPYITYLLSTFMGNGIIVSKGEVWRNQRKVVEPAFHMEELEKFVDTFNEVANFLCEKLAETKGEETEVSVLLVNSATCSVAASIFCTKADLVVPDKKKQFEMASQGVDFVKAFSKIIYRPWRIIGIFKWLTPEGRALIRMNNIFKYMVDNGLAVAKENIGNANISGRSLSSYLRPERNLEFTYSEKEVHDLIVTLFSAGIETTADTIGYLLTLLGLHPEWQERAQRELDDVFGHGGDYLRPCTIADIAQLTVLDAVVKETLRLFSTVPCMPYLVTEDTLLAGGRHVAPRGSTVLVAYYLMHRHPQLFPQPFKFDPGRFLEGGSATTRKPYSYVPFGVGPRKCLGARFAVLQIKITLAMVLRRYRILPGSSRQELEDSVLSITSHPLTGFRVTCVPRDTPAPSSL